MLKMYKKKRSQATIQFIILLTFVFLAFILFLAFAGEKYTSLSKEKHALAIKDTTLKIKSEIDLANSMQEGYEREFSIPSNIGGREYTIHINNNYLTLFTDSSEYTVFIPDFDGNILTGDNIIRKKNNTVCINTCSP